MAFDDVEKINACHDKYGIIETIFPPSATTVICTIVILGFTLFLEAYVSAKEEKLPKPNTTMDANAPPPYSAEAPGNETQAGGRLQLFGQEAMSPKTLANRFAVATFSMIPITVAFAFRINETRMQYNDDCQRVLKIPPTQWWAITLFNILPLVCACMAWLGSLVNCILVRFDISLSVDWWPPAFPIVVTWKLIRHMFYLFRNVTMWMMGRSDEIEDERDIEMDRGDVDEEERGLMGDIDGTVAEMEDNESSSSVRTGSSAGRKGLSS